MTKWKPLSQAFTQLATFVKKDLRQIATAVGEGGIAGQQAFKYVESHSDRAKSSVSEH